MNLADSADTQPLADLVEARLGLRVTEAHWEKLARAAGQARSEIALHPAPSLGEGPLAGWIRRLKENPSAWSGAECQSIINHLTVGETYFFRDERAGDALERRILPELIRRRRGSRQLRFWSAGCCTGEEPATLAIMLERLLPDIDDWDILILATDINETFLARARTGIYSEWSFRATAASDRARFFSEHGGGQYRLSPRIQKRIDFSALNLAGPNYPAANPDCRDMDLILCRNVLMYFAPGQAKAAVERLRDTLSPEGWLALSPSEHGIHHPPGLRSVNCDGAFLYCKQPAGSKAAADAPLAKLPARAPAGPRNKPAAAPRRPAAGPPPATKVVPNERAAAPPIVAAQRAANDGQLSHALNLCDAAISQDKLNPSLRLLRARVLVELGRSAEAGKTFHQALYLDPNYLAAHFALGSWALAQRRPTLARRHFQRTNLLLREFSPETVLPELDGLTAGSLAHLIEQLTQPTHASR